MSRVITFIFVALIMFVIAMLLSVRFVDRSADAAARRACEIDDGKWVAPAAKNAEPVCFARDGVKK